MEKINVIEMACEMVLNDEIDDAQKLIGENYKHEFIRYDKRSMNNFEKLKVYLNDGFVDRYTGKRLLFPSVLRILSIKLKDVFPFHKNWKMSDCHMAYWEYMPTCDHVIPVARGGKDVPENIITTSQKMNSVKSGFLIEEIGLRLHEKGDLTNWDGMIVWYLEYVKKNNDILKDDYINNWHGALLKCMHLLHLEKHN
jgi:hypothetical protein